MYVENIVMHSWEKSSKHKEEANFFNMMLFNSGAIYAIGLSV